MLEYTEYNTYIKAVPETDIDKEMLKILMEQPEETESLEKYISEIVNSNYENMIYTNYKGINLILERITMTQS